MISHEYKCIFIHIPGTGGSYIEELVCGQDWWGLEDERFRDTKHLTASQAKLIYEEYWNSYFKFSFVRNPWSRTLSLTKFPDTYGVIIDREQKIDITGYKKKYGYPLTIEHDWRFTKPINSDRHQKNCVYLNMIDEDLDFVGKYENFEMDLKNVFCSIGLNKKIKVKAWLKGGGNRKPYKQVYTENSEKEIYDMYEKDIGFFMYKF